MKVNVNLDRFKNIQVEQNTVKEHTILVVDDETTNVQSLLMLLDKDYHVLTAQDGDEALTLIQNDPQPERIHLIISDQRMPKMTGVEFLKRTIPIIPKTIRIILTGFTDIEAIIESINEGQIYRFLTKPIEPVDLMITVKRALENYELESQNLLLTTSNHRLTEVNQTKESLLQKLNDLYERNLPELEHLIQEGVQQRLKPDEVYRQTLRDIQQIRENFQSITKLYSAEKAIRHKRVLLAESNKKQQLIAKMALGGTGVDLDIASDLETGRELLGQYNYNIICVDQEMIDLVPDAHERNPLCSSVFMTSDDASIYLLTLKQYPMISNIVSRNEEDRTFILKNILTTVSKLLTQDVFGLDKYLNWGVDIRQHMVERSNQRDELIQAMETYFEQLGIRRTLLQRSVGVAEELLMNAIYDAPTDPQGNSLYNQLSRTEQVLLKPEERSVFRYACDGVLMGISVADPFGAFRRHTILEYLESGYTGRTGTLQQKKGGAGIGLFKIMRNTDLLVWNVKSGIKTEIIALFNVDPHAIKQGKTTSFHYFSI